MPNPYPLAPRPIGRLNARGLWTLYVKEVRRFLNVATQTLLAPMVTTLLFLAVFTLALGGQRLAADGTSYGAFLAPGLMVMAMMQNAFANTSSSMVIAKVQGNIVDVLMPPLSGFELTLGFTAGGMTRGLLVGCVVWLAQLPFVGLHLHAPLVIVFYAVMTSMMLSLLGLLGGIWAEKFDHMAAVTNFLIMPMTFLSGVFYSIHSLPAFWQQVSHLNPFFYMIDGFRYGFFGVSDVSPWLSLSVVGAALLLVSALALHLLKTGYKIRY